MKTPLKDVQKAMEKQQSITQGKKEECIKF